MLDFAVNVRHAQPPAWLVRRLAARLPDLARYPGADDESAAIQAVAARHGRARDEVALLTGTAEGFALLPNLRPTLAAVIAPSFTEPAVALRSAGVRVQHVVLERPFGLAGVQVPVRDRRERRPHLVARVEAVRTAGVERAAGRQVDHRGRRALDRQQLRDLALDATPSFFLITRQQSPAPIIVYCNRVVAEQHGYRRFRKGQRQFSTHGPEVA